MKRELVEKTYQHILNDNKLISLATITSFFHSLVLMCLIVYRTYSIVNTYNGNSPNFDQIGEVFQTIFSSGNLIWGFLVLALIGAVGYYLVPPISDAALIYYLDKYEKDGSGKIVASIGRGLGQFFPLFEFTGTLSMFNIILFSVTVSRMWVYGILFNPFVLTLAILWAISIFSIGILTPYTKFFIVLEKMKVFDAMKASAKMSMENLGSTIKFVLIKYFLSLRFVINVLIFIGLPAVVIYYGGEYFSINGLKNSMLILFLIMIIVSAYITGIIEAFFMTYWYNIYKSLKPKPETTN